MGKLTVKQENFCNYYLESGNASEAYRRAYSCGNMAPDTINRKAIELLQNGKITARVGQLQAILQERSDISKDEAVKELTNIVRCRITDVLNAKGKTVTIKKLEDLPDGVVACISSIKSARGTVEVKFYDKIQAIDRLCKMLGWDDPFRVDLQGSVNTGFLEQMSNEELEKFIRGEIDRQGFNETPKE